MAVSASGIVDRCRDARSDNRSSNCTLTRFAFLLHVDLALPFKHQSPHKFAQLIDLCRLMNSRHKQILPLFGLVDIDMRTQPARPSTTSVQGALLWLDKSSSRRE